jgi:AraC-like DNA-binding protein
MYNSKIFHNNRYSGFFIEHAKRINPYSMINNHYHAQYEIYYLLAGDRNYFIRDRVYNVQKGDLVLVNSNVLHKTVDGFSDFHERLLIEFDMSFFDGFLVNYNDLQLLSAFNTDSTILRLEDSERKQIKNCFFKILQESKDNSIENNIALKVYFLELLIIINKFSDKAAVVQFNHPTELHKKISEIVAYINDHYMYDISLDVVANHFFISSAHLSRAFKKVTGFSFVEYVNSLRIKEAQKFFIETKLSVSDIAKKVGYQSSTHFGRVFKAITGNSPRDYKKLL